MHHAFLYWFYSCRSTTANEKIPIFTFYEVKQKKMIFFLQLRPGSYVVLWPCWTYAPINVKPAGGGRAWGGDLIVFVGPGVGYLTNLFLPGEGIFESFFARRRTDVLMDLTADSDERDWDRTYVSPLPRFTHATYGLERSGNHGSQREQAKGEWILLYWSIEPFKILWYQSKRK